MTVLPALVDARSKDESLSLALSRMLAEHEKAVATMRQGERQRLAAAAKEFDNIFEGNKATLGYLNSLEDKVKAGQLPGPEMSMGKLWN